MKNIVICGLLYPQVDFHALILTLKSFVGHSAPLYLSEFVEERSSSTNTLSSNDDLLLVIQPLGRNCSNI